MRAKAWRQGLWVGVLLLVIAWLGYLIWGLTLKARVAWDEEHQVKVQYDALETRRAELQANVDSLQTPRGQDAAIREAFGVAKPGEEVIVVVPPVAPTSTPERSWWERLVDWF